MILYQRHPNYCPRHRQLNSDDVDINVAVVDNAVAVDAVGGLSVDVADDIAVAADVVVATDDATLVFPF